MKGILQAVLRSPLTVQRQFSEGQPHHITLFYGVEQRHWQKWIGEQFEATAIANIYTNDIQAIALLMPEHIPHKANPHITVSYREGIAPVASNHLMLDACDRHVEAMNQNLSFEIAFYPFSVPECHHQWRKNGKRNDLQVYDCRLCGKTMTEGGNPKGRPKKKLI
jgi:hypothetical protein